MLILTLAEGADDGRTKTAHEHHMMCHYSQVSFAYANFVAVYCCTNNTNTPTYPLLIE